MTIAIPMSPDLATELDVLVIHACALRQARATASQSVIDWAEVADAEDDLADTLRSVAFMLDAERASLFPSRESLGDA